MDAYDTIVTCDFSPLRRGVPALAGIPAGTWEQEYDQVGPLLTDGRMSKAEAFGHILGKCGVQAADGLVLSCEVGVAKPAAEIFQYALDRLGVTAGATVFVDDQAGFCAGSVAAGVRSVQIIRCEADGRRPAAGTAVVRSLPEVGAMFPG